MALKVGELYAELKLHDAQFKAQLKSIQQFTNQLTKQISREMNQNIKSGLQGIKGEAVSVSRQAAGQIKNSFSGVGNDIKKSFSGIGKSLNFDLSLGPLNSLTTGFSTAGLVAGTAFGLAADAITKVTEALKGAYNTGKEFEAQMSVVASVAFDLDTLNTDAGQAAFKALEDQAIQLGSSTIFTATQVGEAQELLARAGFSVNETLQATPGLLSAAAAEGLGLAQTADIASSALRGFGLEASDMSMVADLLAKTSATSNASITSLGESFKYIAPVAQATSLDIVEVNAALGLLANNGLKGSIAGRNLASGLMTLVAPSKEARKLMNSLGIAVSDAESNFKSLPAIFGELSKATKGLGEAQALANIETLVGKDNAKTYLALLNTQYKTVKDGKEITLSGAEAMQVYSDALNGSAGAAEQMANIRLDNLEGDLERLSGAADSLGIQLFKTASPAFRDLAQTATAALEKLTPLIVSVFGKIVSTVQQISKEALPGFKQAWVNLQPAIKQLGPIITKALGFFAGLAIQAGKWGGQIVSNLAKGMSMAAGPIVRVLKYIGGIISYWLKPNSPPKIVPDLDVYGRETGQLYVDSFGKADTKSAFSTLGNEIKERLRNTTDDVAKVAEEAGETLSTVIARGVSNWNTGDFELFNNLSSEIEKSIRDLADSGSIPADQLIPSIFSGREAIQEVVDDIREFGDVSETSIQKVINSVGNAGPEVGNLVRSYAALRKASAEVAKAQERLNKVTQEYDEKLGPLNAQLSAINKEQSRIRDMQRIEELQKDLAEGKLDDNEAALAQLEIQEIQTRQQIDNIEDEKAAAVKAEEAKVTAAQEAEKAAADQFETVKLQLQQNRDNNELMREQVRILDELKKAQEEAAKAAAGTGGGDTGGGGIDLPTFDPDAMGLPEDITQPFEEFTTEIGKIGKSIDDFNNGIKDAQLAISGFFDGIGGKVNPAREAIDKFFSSPLGTELREGAGVIQKYFAEDFVPDMERGLGVIKSAMDRVDNSEFGQSLKRGAGVVGAYILNEWPGDFQRGTALVASYFLPMATDANRNFTSVQTGAGNLATYMLDEWPVDFRNGVDLVSATLSQFDRDVTTGFNTAKTTITGTLDDIRMYMTDQQINFENAAIGVGNAIIKGISSTLKIENLRETIAQLVRDLPVWLKQLLGIDGMTVAPPKVDPGMRDSVPGGRAGGGYGPSTTSNTTTNNTYNTYNVTDKNASSSGGVNEVRILEMLRS